MKIVLNILLLVTACLPSHALNTDSLKTVITGEKNVEKKIRLYNLLCNNLEGQDLLRQTTAFYNYSEQNNSEEGIALASDNLGWYYQSAKPDSAIYFYEKSLTYYLKIKNNDQIGHFYNELGVCYYIKGDLNRSLDNYLKALSYVPDEDPEFKKATTLNNVAQIYSKLGQTDKALASYNKVIALFAKKGNKQMAAAVNQNIGMMLTDKERYDEAEKYLLIALNGITPDNKVYSQVIANLGLNYTLKGDAEKGKVYLQKAAALLRKENNPGGLAFVLANLGTTYNKLGKDYEAIKFGLEGYELSKQLGFLDNMERTSHMLARTYEKTGDYKNALKYNKIYFKMHDSIVSENVVKQLNALNMQYESNKKDYELLKQADVIDKKEILIQKQNIEAEKKSKFIVILSLVGIFILIIAVFVFRAYKQKKKANEIITAQKQEVEKQKSIIELQKEQVEEHQKEILDSIHYAKRIQQALLTNADFMKEHVPQNFIFFKPKDIVSGDFYWACHRDNKFYLAVCDSTGHGVPGAFMSLLNIGFISEAINEKNIVEPNHVFDYVRTRLVDSISKDGQKDGFDGILMCIDHSEQKISYASAHNSPIIVSDKKLIELDADKMPVGEGERTEGFKLFNLDYIKGTMIYLYTDGFADQFGGPKGKKYKYKLLNQLLLSISTFSLHEQKEKLELEFGDWKGELEQVDDVCIIGIKL